VPLALDGECGASQLKALAGGAVSIAAHFPYYIKLFGAELAVLHELVVYGEAQYIQ
jgi:hypothetical protein